MAKQRIKCDCEAQGNHKLINNCINCGKIVCEKEGEGPCLFCGNIVQKKGEIIIDDSQFPDMDSKNAFTKALLHKEKLLDFHRRDIHQSNIIDDQADYYQIVDDVWQNEEIRNQAIQKLIQQEYAEQTTSVKQELDLTTMQYKLITESNALDQNEQRYEAQQLLIESQKQQNIKNNQNKKDQKNNNLDNDCEQIYHQVKDSLIQQEKQQQLENKKSNKNQKQFKPTSCKVQFDDEFFQQFQNELCQQISKEEETKDDSLFDIQFYQVEDGIGCLSMHQPWASLVIEGFKRIEGRMWGTNYKGPLWIHAGAKQPETELISQIEYQYQELYKNYKGVPKFPARYPTGALIGVVDMIGFVKANTYNELVQKDQQEEGDTEFKFVFRNPRKLMYPISMRGSNNIFKLDEEIRQIALKSLQRIPISWGPYLIKQNQVASDPIIEKPMDDSMQKIQDQFHVKQDSKQNNQQKIQVTPIQDSNIQEDDNMDIEENEEQQKKQIEIQKNDGKFEKQMEWGILLQNILKKDHLLKIATFLSSKITKQQKSKGVFKQSFPVKGIMPHHDIIIQTIQDITGNENIYNQCTVNYLKLADKQVQIKSATALFLIGQNMDIIYNNEKIKLTQGKVLLIENGYNLTAQFSQDNQDDNLLRDISQDYVYKSWLVQLEQ